MLKTCLNQQPDGQSIPGGCAIPRLQRKRRAKLGSAQLPLAPILVKKLAALNKANEINGLTSSMLNCVRD